MLDRQKLHQRPDQVVPPHRLLDPGEIMQFGWNCRPVRKAGIDQHRHTTLHQRAGKLGAGSVFQPEVEQRQLRRMSLDPTQSLGAIGEWPGDLDPDLFEVSFKAHRDEGLILSNETDGRGDRADSDTSGRGFRSEAGRSSDVKPATIPV